MGSDARRITKVNKDIVRISIRELLSLNRMHRDAGSIQQFLENTELKEQSWNNALNILQIWMSLQELISKYALWNERSALPEIKSHLNTVLQLLSKLIFFNVVKKPKSLKECFVARLRFDRPLYRYQGWDLPLTCIMPLSTEPGQVEFESIIQTISQLNLDSDFIIILVPGQADNIRRMKNYYNDYNIIIFDEYDLKTLLFADDTKILFNRIVIRDIDRRKVQPYSHTSIRPGMFYGRQDELGEIIRNRGQSFAIYGPRRIGKTFLLKQVQDKINAERACKAIYFSCQNNSIAEVKYRLLRELEAQIDIENVSRFEENLRLIIKNSQHGYVFLLDEIDDLIEEDTRSDYQFVTSLRNIWNENREKCQFVFAGFQTLASRFHDQAAPFYNYAAPLPLENLKQDDAIRLIIQPMEDDLFLEFLDTEACLNRIVETTMCHPALIQFMCRRLIDIACEEKRVYIHPKDIELIFNDSEYRSLISRSFWHILEKEQQIIALQMLQMNEKFTNVELQACLAEKNIHVPIADLERNLEKMIASGMITKSEQFYSFANSLFAPMLRLSEDTISLFERLRKEVYVDCE